MEKIDIINEFIKMFFISLYIFYIYVKIINYNDITLYKILIILLSCIFISLVYLITINYINTIAVIIILYFLYDIILSKISKNDLYYSTLVMIISFIIVYTTYIFSVIIAGLIIYYLKFNINIQNPVANIIIHLIEISLILIVIRIKRIKNGLKFLKNPNKVRNITLYLVFIGGIILAILGTLKGSENEILNTLLLIGTCLIFISLVIWIKNQITKQYKENMRNRTIEIQKQEIDEQSKIIENIKDENYNLAKVIHKYNNRLNALELSIKKIITENTKTEFSNELSGILEETKKISSNFSKETTIKESKIPKTGLLGIDNMFVYMQEECNKNNIHFDLKINESINPLIEKIIKEDKFETLIGDHLKDAIIAVNKSKNKFKSILVILGIIENCYELSIYDTGIEFDIKTLLTLGLEPITTNKENGGSGIGFMTTFETLKECMASLIIEEYDPKTTDYSKSVTIRFDNKNEYKIRSYRANDIKKEVTNYRTIIEKI